MINQKCNTFCMHVSIFKCTFYREKAVDQMKKYYKDRKLTDTQKQK